MKVLLIITLIPLIGASLCPDGWKDAPNICYKLTENRAKFRESIIECLTLDPIKTGPNVNLIRVGQLRKLKAITSKSLEHRGPWVRVDAIKDPLLGWVEYLSRQQIQFTSFPAFNPNDGHPGQTLVYNVKDQVLRIVYPQDDDFHGLCYREVRGVPESCYSAGNENECSDHGDCVNGACKCDAGFSGTKCATPGAGRELEADTKDPKMESGCTEFVRDDGSLACLVALTESKSYHDAMSACVAKGFKLAEVHGPKDQENLETFVQGFKSAWIPLTSFDGAEGFTWESGKSLTYNNWAVQPTAREGKPNPCVILDPINEHKWTDVSCDETDNRVGICSVY